MGYHVKTVLITAHVSRHNSERDAEDDAAWADFRRKVGELAEREEYRDLDISFVGLGNP